MTFCFHDMIKPFLELILVQISAVNVLTTPNFEQKYYWYHHITIFTPEIYQPLKQLIFLMQLQHNMSQSPFFSQKRYQITQ